MKRFFLITVMTLILSGCTTNGVYDPAKTWTLVGVVAVGAVVASDSGSSGGDEENCFIVVGPGGSDQVCR